MYPGPGGCTILKSGQVERETAFEIQTIICVRALDCETSTIQPEWTGANQIRILILLIALLMLTSVPEQAASDHLLDQVTFFSLHRCRCLNLSSAFPLDLTTRLEMPVELYF